MEIHGKQLSFNQEMGGTTDIVRKEFFSPLYTLKA
jgi:hypothetical protein